MRGQVAIVGVGIEGLRPVSPEQSYREMIHAAAVRAYLDAGIEPDAVDSVVTVAEDFAEGVSIFDEYTPDQLGAVLKPVHTIAGDGLQGLAAAALQVATGAFEVVVLEAHSKASNVLNMAEVEAYALDPVWNRPLGFHPHALAGLEMGRYLHDSGTSLEQSAAVVTANRRNALANPRAAHGADLHPEVVAESGSDFQPLRRAEMAPSADGAVVLVLASRRLAETPGRRPVWLEGIGWSTDAPGLEDREWGRARYAEQAARRAYRMAGVESPPGAIDLVEVDDRFAYKQLQHLEALALCGPGEAGPLQERGHWSPDGPLPANVSGGSLGAGNLHDATSVYRVAEVVNQLRYGAGDRQIDGVVRGLVQSWRGPVAATGGVAILSNARS